MVAVGLVAGLLVAATVVVAALALAPQPVPLAGRVKTVLDAPDRRRTTGGRSWQRRLLPAGDQLTADLAAAGTSIEQLLTRQLLWTGAGGLLPLLAWPAGLATLGTSWLAAPLVAVAGAGAGWWLALHETRDQAARRRREMALALAAYLQLASTMIRAGTAEEQALRDAAAAGTGWSFELLRAALDRAVQAGTTIAVAFEDLGRHIGLVELRALAAELRIASRQGSSPARTLAARAASLRDQELATQLAAAARADKRMAAPLVGLGLCVVVFIVFPALAIFIGGR